MDWDLWQCQSSGAIIWHCGSDDSSQTGLCHWATGKVVLLPGVFLCGSVGHCCLGSLWQQSMTMTLPLGVVWIRLSVVSPLTWVCQLSLKVDGWQVDIHSGRHSVSSATRPVYIISKSCTLQNNSIAAIVGCVCRVSFLALTEFHGLSIYDNWFHYCKTNL